jgi:hypothetical protein
MPQVAIHFSLSASRVLSLNKGIKAEMKKKLEDLMNKRNRIRK